MANWPPPARAFEDYEVGEAILTGGRTVDQADINLFAGLTGDNYPLHVNAMWAEQGRFGERIAHGPLTFSVAVGLVALSGWYGDCIEALLECRTMRATAPVRSGDTLRVRATVLETADHKSPKYGVLHVGYDVINQKDESVMNFHWVMLARRRTPLEIPNA
ncbi:MAG: MaoC/PaaZ C-terminal domain-containing protein [Sporichthyaceae bacterium]